MAAISSPNLVRATMHMRGELGTNQKPLLVQTKSQGMSTIEFPALNYFMVLNSPVWIDHILLRYGTFPSFWRLKGHLLEQALYSNEKPARPVSMMPDYNYKEDYGPLIIDSVVQTPIISAPIPQTNPGICEQGLLSKRQLLKFFHWFFCILNGSYWVLKVHVTCVYF